MGAKFSPCMRQDGQVHDLIREKRAIERNSACCVRNDRSGCVQTSEEQCSVCNQVALFSFHNPATNRHRGEL